MESPFNDETLLARWMSGELTEAERQSVQNHPDYPQWKRIVDTVDQWKNPSYDQSKAWENLQQAKGQAETPVRRLSPIRWLALAASLALFVVFWFLIPRQHTIVAQRGQKQQIELPAASQVALNAGSNLSYNASNWEKERLLELQGEAFFEVTHGVPFIVETALGQVEVLGTQFNVFSRDDQMEVQCYSGKVRVSFPQGAQYTLGAGQSVRLANNRITPSDDGEGNQPAWMKGESVFDKTPITEVFQELERQYDVQIDYQGDPGRPYNGAFPHDDLEKALQIITGSFGLQYNFSNNQKTIRIEE